MNKGRNMKDTVELIDIKEFAMMMRRSESWIRLCESERRRGINTDTATPAPISTRPKQKLLWVKDECIRYIERLNAAANGTPPPQTQPLPPDVVQSAHRLGLSDDNTNNQRNKNGGKK